MSQVIQCFLGADLRLGHQGLALLAKKNRIDVQTLNPGQFVLFINTGKNKLKLYASNQIVAYLRLDKGRTLDLKTIREIPRAFLATGRIDYDQTLRETIESALASKGRLEPFQ